MGLSTIAEHSLQIKACRMSRERGFKIHEVESNSWLLEQFDCGATFCTCLVIVARVITLSSPGEARDGSVESHPSCRILVGDASIGTFLDFLGRPPIFYLAHFWQTGHGSEC